MKFHVQSLYMGLAGLVCVLLFFAGLGNILNATATSLLDSVLQVIFGILLLLISLSLSIFVLTQRVLVTEDSFTTLIFFDAPFTETSSLQLFLYRKLAT